MAASGTYNFLPDVASLTRDAFARIQIFASQLTALHLIEARLSMNLWLQDVAGNAGINLFAVDQINLALPPGQLTFQLPGTTIELLDVYLRTFSNSGAEFLNIGAALTPLGPPGNPLVSQPWGDPLLIGPPSGTIWTTVGDQRMTLNWPNHGLTPGQPIFWTSLVSAGGIVLSGMSIASETPDNNTIIFYAPQRALETQTGQGATPLYSTTANSPTVSVILPSHGYSAGDTFTVGVATTVGGVALAAGSYTVTAVQSLYAFTITPGPEASATASVFENAGRLNVATQSNGTVTPTDIILYPLSRNDFAAIPQKYVPGRPTTFWFNRVYPPNFSIYPVVPAGFFYGFMAYRLRQIQDANPVMGQTLEMPPRFYEAFASGLCAKLAEKFRPEAHAAKLALANAAWDRASSADVEHAIFSIKPNLSGLYR